MTRTPDDRQFQYFPAFLDLVRRRVVVVGGGEIATGKVRALLPCGVAPLIVVAPDVSTFIDEQAGLGRLVHIARGYSAGDLNGAALAFGATDDRELNACVARDARQAGILVLAVDDVPNCDFISPALVRRGDLVVAISTHGRSPAVARRAREWLDEQLPQHWGTLLNVAAAARERLGPVRSRISVEAWQAALRGSAEDLVQHGASEGAAVRALVDDLLRTTTYGLPD